MSAWYVRRKKKKTILTTFCYLPTTTAQQFRFGCLYTIRGFNNYTGNANFIAAVLYFNKIFQCNYIFSLLFFLPYIFTSKRGCTVTSLSNNTHIHSPSSSLNNLWYEMIKKEWIRVRQSLSEMARLPFGITDSRNFFYTWLSTIIPFALRPSWSACASAYSWEARGCRSNSRRQLLERCHILLAVVIGRRTSSTCSTPAQCSKTLNLFMIFFCIFYFFFYYCAANTI